LPGFVVASNNFHFLIGLPFSAKRTLKGAVVELNTRLFLFLPGSFTNKPLYMHYRAVFSSGMLIVIH
jgi:hypothetical protein